jgi:hypothetical protein
VVTFFARRAMPAYVIAILSKSDRSNFNAAEIQAMASFTARILAALKSKPVG